LDISFNLQVGANTTSGTSYISAYILPLNEDSTTYGDNSLSSNNTFLGSPGSQYYGGVAQLGKVITTGLQATGTISQIIIPPGPFILALQNNLGNALGSSTILSTAAVRSYDDGIG